MIAAADLLTERGFESADGKWWSMRGATFRLVEKTEDVIFLLSRSEETSYKSFRWLQRFFGSARVTESGKAWSQLRSESQNFYTRAASMDVEAVTSEAFGHFANRLDERNERWFDLLDLKWLAGDVLSRIVLGAPMSEVGLVWDDVLFINEISLETAFLRSPSQELSQDIVRRLLQAKISSTDAIQNWIDRNDVPYCLMNNGDRPYGNRMTGELFSFFFGPLDTIALFSGWMCRRLSRDEYSGSPQSFMIETLKAYPPIPLLNRKMLVDMILPSGEELKAGDGVFLSLLGQSGSSAVLTAFSFGQRTCPGRNIAFRVGRAFLDEMMARGLVPVFIRPERPRWNIIMDDGSHFTGRMRYGEELRHARG